LNIINNFRLKSYITGFVEGEGCFSISFNLRPRLISGIKVRPSFVIGQNERNLRILKMVKDYFDCGSIRYFQNDSIFRYEARSLREINQIIIPHFLETPLIGVKSTDFDNFYKVYQMMSKGLHLRPDTLKEIVNIAYKINGGNRKLSKNELLNKITS